MNYLIAGLVLFIGIHLLPVFASFRRIVVNRLGEATYMAIFSLLAFFGLALIIYGMVEAEFISVIEPPAWGKYITLSLMPASIILLAAANMPSNIKRITANPMLWGILLWSLGHLMSNGDKASLFLFGSFALYALIDLISVGKRNIATEKVKLAFSKDIIVIVAGLLVYAALLYFHSNLFGVAVITGV